MQVQRCGRIDHTGLKAICGAWGVYCTKWQPWGLLLWHKIYRDFIKKFAWACFRGYLWPTRATLPMSSRPFWKSTQIEDLILTNYLRVQWWESTFQVNCWGLKKTNRILMNCWRQLSITHETWKAWSIFFPKLTMKKISRRKKSWAYSKWKGESRVPKILGNSRILSSK